ncbi:MrcB family domain-containing protein [Streptomyces fuscigenes]|uniref:MrcB family domain-containing protein n=1 Tax=Streptomyces fuscigenes TaxID=1528880 RepID=UPI001F239D31|nr:DUF3578 domain-containing protein [Streptomyces fuscigenes]MCF3962248.1 DUF3578 domain-containing protein [Streptomyces fuscigenes]
MGLQSVLVDIGKTYDATAGTKRGVVGQQILRDVKNRKDLGLPEPLFARGYGGQSTAAATPWIGVYDPRINSEAVDGVYLAYIFSTDLRTVWLTLQQGITKLEDKVGRGAVREEHLRRSADRLRRLSAMQRRNGWVREPQLKPTAIRPKAYEAASVIARGYDLSAMPSDQELYEDLVYASGLLSDVSRAHAAWLVEDSETVIPVSYRYKGHVGPTDVGDERDALAGFEPKDSSDYVAHISAKQQIKRRTHETLISDFATHAADQGFLPITKLQHPRDLVLRPSALKGEPGREVLVEAKVIQRKNPTEAVRQAVGQLMEYSHFLYQGRERPYLLALFSSDVGVYAGYLEGLGIASVWRTETGWGGSVSARGWGIVD